MHGRILMTLYLLILLTLILLLRLAVRGRPPWGLEEPGPGDDEGDAGTYEHAEQEGDGRGEPSVVLL